MKSYIIKLKKSYLPIYAYVDLPVEENKFNELEKDFKNLKDGEDLKVFLLSNYNDKFNLTGQYAKVVSISSKKKIVSIFVEGFAVLKNMEKTIEKLESDKNTNIYSEEIDDKFTFVKKKFLNLKSKKLYKNDLDSIVFMLNSIPEQIKNNLLLWINKEEYIIAFSNLYALDIDEDYKIRLDDIFQYDNIVDIFREVNLIIQDIFIGYITVDKIKKESELGFKDTVLISALEKQIDIAQKKLNDLLREYAIREGGAVENENGDIILPNEEENSGARSYRERIQNHRYIPENIKKILEKDLKAISRCHQMSQEYGVLATYFDLVLALPWNNYSSGVINISQDKIKKELDKSIYGLENVKKRIAEMLAYLKLQTNMNAELAQIICLVGPPGTGKTSIAKLIAKCTNREFVQISLAGLHDEAELRGHRRTYVGAIPGRIISELSKIKTSNPLILFDEIDKISNITSSSGNAAYALLEILDATQNKNFKDHYLNLPYDISKCLFVTTANDFDGISAPLLDRMQIIKIKGYTEEEKVQIAKKFIIPKKEKEIFDKVVLSFKEDAIRTIINEYTYESGVRKLSEKIEIILNKVYEEVVHEVEKMNSTDKIKKESEKTSLKDQVINLLKNNKLTITKSEVKKLLDDSPIKQNESLMKEDQVGVVNGLAWTLNGGTILNIESVKLKGDGKIKFTGSLGDVMKESVNVAYSFVKSYLTKNHKDVKFDEYDIHVHAPEAATPKDGPSAGTALACVIYSTLTEKKIRSKIAMTGEISLLGYVLPIGGIDEKLQGAIRAGMELVLLPYDNKDEYLKVKKEIRDKIKVKFVKTMDEVLKEVIC